LGSAMRSPSTARCGEICGDMRRYAEIQTFAAAVRASSAAALCDASRA